MELDEFVGREAELAELQTQFDTMLAGNGGIVFVTGQAGSGKTVLVRHFLDRVLEATPEVVAAAGSGNAQTGAGDPYLPFREALGLLTGDISPDQAVGKISATSAGRLRTVMVRSVQVLVEVAPELVNVMIPGGKLLALIGQQMAKKVGWMERLDALVKRRQDRDSVADTTNEQVRIVEKFTAFLTRLSQETPLVLFFDDLQWADVASINLLFHLARHVQHERILVIGAYRPSDVLVGRNGQRHPLEPAALELTRYLGDITIDLDEIPEVLSRRFVDALLDTEPNQFDPGFRDALFLQTGGHALFTVELLRGMRKRHDLIRTGDGFWRANEKLDWSTLPAKIEGVIAERIGRLDDELRTLLTTASVDGQMFFAEVVARVEAMPEREAIHLLSDELARRHGLLAAQGIAQIGGARLSVYRFVHNLFHQYIYGNLADAERMYLHRDLGNALEEIFATRTDEVAARLARHFELAGIPDKAARYRLQAGNAARRMSAHHEALVHLKVGIDLIAEIPASVERDALELSLQTALGTALVVTNGYGSNDVQKAFARARELSGAMHDAENAIPVIFGLATHHLVCGALDQAHSLGSQLLDLAQQTNDTGYVLGAHLVMGISDMYRGELDSSREHLEKAVVEYEPAIHCELAYSQGQDPAVAALGFLALALMTQGYLDQARLRLSQALALAERIDHDYSTAYINGIAAVVYLSMRLEAECRKHAEMVAAASENRFPLWKAASSIALGWLAVKQGQTDDGIAAMEAGLSHWEGSGARTAAPNFRANLADAYRMVGRPDDGLKVIEVSIADSAQGWWLPEQHRLHAELLLIKQGDEGDVERELRLSVSLAQAMGAHLLELRAAVSLARLMAKTGRSAEGRELLRASARWFKEGADTPDVQSAMAVLDELAQPGVGAAWTGPMDAVGDAAGDVVGDAMGMLA